MSEKEQGNLKINIFKKLFLFCICQFVAACAPFGADIDKEILTKYTESKQFNKAKMSFENRQPELFDQMNGRWLSFDGIESMWNSSEDRDPLEILPEGKPDLKEFFRDPKEFKGIWFGHSTFLLQMDGKTILIDPIFSAGAAPVNFLVPRFQSPALSLEQLPKVDFIVISHDHYDHLDFETIEYFADKATRFIVPLVLGEHLRYWGVPKERIVEKDWWESYSEGGLSFTAAPCQHFSGRGLTPNQTLWASWIIKSSKTSLYFSGDSGYDIHFKEIGERLGPFDIAFLETGQYNRLWPEVHLMPKDGVNAFYDLRAKRYFPIHWGMFALSTHPWFEPIELIHQASKEKGFKLLSPRIGEVFGMNHPVEPWWKSVKRHAE